MELGRGLSGALWSSHWHLGLGKQCVVGNDRQAGTLRVLACSREEEAPSAQGTLLPQTEAI